MPLDGLFSDEHVQVVGQCGLLRPSNWKTSGDKGAVWNPIVARDAPDRDVRSNCRPCEG